MEREDKTITPPDVTTSLAGETTAKPTDGASVLENADTPLFNPSGAVNPSEPSKGAAPIPEAPEKRGRGRPKGTGKTAPKTKPVAKLQEDAAVTVATANAAVVVGMLDLIRAAVSAGECPANPDMREAAQSAWAAYLAEQGMELPAWVQVAIVSTMYVAPAFSTPRGKGLISGAWAKARGWWIAKRG